MHSSSRRTLTIDIENDVTMARHQVEITTVDGEDIRELHDAIDDSLVPVFLAIAGKRIHTKEQGTANTVQVAVLAWCFFWKHQFFPRLWHCITPYD